MISEGREPAVSVIVPVYKVEPYLRQCIDSILAQTFADFELILIDDGSPDNCGAICDEYAVKDDRVVVIHQENGGLSAARNAGIDWVFANSESQWIAFVDSDDVIDVNYLAVLYDPIRKKRVQISLVYPKHFSEDMELCKFMPREGEIEILSGKEACRRMYTGVDVYFVSAWAKLYSIKLFSTFRYPVGKIFEDQHLGPMLLYSADSVAITHTHLYYYRQRPGSIITTQFSVTKFDYIDALKTCEEFFEVRKEKEIKELVFHQKRMVWAEHVLRAQRYGLYGDIPYTNRLPLWKAYWYVLSETLRRGGLKFVFIRLGNLIRKFTKK